MRYIFAKVRGGEKGEVLRDNMISIISFEFIETDKFDLRVFNKFIKDKSESYPTMNNSDVNALRNVGRTVVYMRRYPETVSIMIFDIEHKNNTEIKSYLRNLRIDNLI